MVALLVTCIYLLLAGVHVYWALGGRLGKHAAVPRLPRKASAGATVLRLVGLFKRITGSSFAWLDTRVYSPLCLTLSAGLAYVAILPP